MPRRVGGVRSKAGPRRLLPASIADDLGVAIVSGGLKPGRVFAGEIEASSKLRVSRSVYREALRILVSKGLIESRPKAGTKVSHPSAWRLLDSEVLGWVFRADPDPALVANLFELRMIFEPAAVELAASRRTYAQLAIMQEALRVMGERGFEDEQGRAADRLFHQTLLEATGNAFLMGLSPGIAAAIDQTTLFKSRANAFSSDSVPAHRRVFDAVCAQDAVAARQAMRDLIQMGLKDTTLAAVGGKPVVKASERA